MKKRTLNENTIRRFMKLADMSALTENYFVNNTQEDELEEGGLYARDDEELAAEEPALGEPALGEPALDEPALDEPALEEPAAEGPAVGGDVDVVGLVDAIVGAIEQETGVPISTEETPAEEPELDAELAPEPELDAELAPEPEVEDPMLEKVTVDIPQKTIEEEATTDKEVQEERFDALVNEVARRVAQRLSSK